MMNIDKFIADEQDIKAAEKVIPKLNDLLNSDEELLYLAIQKKPAVNLLPDSIAVSNKRLFYCEPGNLGLTMNFKDISWKNIKEVSFKEEFFGSKFICVPTRGENIITEYIPKTQARKLYQVAYEQLERFNEQAPRSDTIDQMPPSVHNAYQTIELEIEDAEIVEPVNEPLTLTSEDETTLKLRKLKSLYEKDLITLEEYENKKAAILDSL